VDRGTWWLQAAAIADVTGLAWGDSAVTRYQAGP